MRQPPECFDATYGNRDTPIEVRALRAIGKHVRISPANLGAVLWGWHTASNCSCPWARPAGAVIKRLRKQGLVERVHDKSGNDRSLYKITRAGERKLCESARTERGIE